MKRNLDLLREIMLAIENDTSGELQIPNLMKLECPNQPAADADDETWDEFELDKANYQAEYSIVAFHVELLRDAGFIEALDASTCSGPGFVILRLTMPGCDYLDNVRSSQVWLEVKKKLGSMCGSVALEVIKSVASGVILSELGVSTLTQ